MALDFLGSPVQRGYGGSSRLKCPDLRLMSPKPFSQCFVQQVTGLGLLLHPFFLCLPSLEVQACLSDTSCVLLCTRHP